MGVTVSFATTLTQINSDQGGQGNRDSDGILLGSSQAQLVTAADGTASVTPSTTGVGPCDVFVAVNAGALSVEFQMENLAAIVPAQPGNAAVKGSRTHDAPHSAAPAAMLQSSVAALFAIPQGDPGTDPVPEPKVDKCLETTQDAAQNPTSAPCPPSKPIETKVPKLQQPESHPKAAAAVIPVPVQPDPAPTKLLLNDKRSCRSLAGDGPFF
jgi:hypothetical protein